MEKSIHYVLIVDQSGSMYELKKEVVSSFNEQLEMIQSLQHKNPNQLFKITLCRFNDQVAFRFINEPVGKIEKLKPDDYQPESCTALYDAIGKSFTMMDEIINANDQVFFAIFTDGLENASTRFTAGDVKEFIQKAEKKDWSIRFICRHEDKSYYTNELNINQYAIALCMNEKGLHQMAHEVNNCLSQLSKAKSKNTT